MHYRVGVILDKDINIKEIDSIVRNIMWEYSEIREIDPYKIDICLKEVKRHYNKYMRNMKKYFMEFYTFEQYLKDHNLIIQNGEVYSVFNKNATHDYFRFIDTCFYNNCYSDELYVDISALTEFFLNTGHIITRLKDIILDDNKQCYLEDIILNNKWYKELTYEKYKSIIQGENAENILVLLDCHI